MHGNLFNCVGGLTARGDDGVLGLPVPELARDPRRSLPVIINVPKLYPFWRGRHHERLYSVTAAVKRMCLDGGKFSLLLGRLCWH